MEFRDNLIEMLSNIIHDKKVLLDSVNDNIVKSGRIQEVLDVLNVSSIGSIDNDALRNILVEITDESAACSIISNIDMMKIVVNGINNGLSLSLDDSQEALISSVYDLISNYKNDLDDNNYNTKNNLEDFIACCEKFGDEISSGVIKDVSTLDVILSESNVPIEDIIDIKFGILKNNNNNFNLHLDGKAKEEIDLRIILKGIDVDLDTFSNIEKDLLVNYGNVSSISSVVDFLKINNISLSKNDLIVLLLFSDVDIVTNVFNICNSYEVSFNSMFKMPGVFVSEGSISTFSNVLNDFRGNDEYYIISFLENIGSYYEIFVKNVSVLSDNGFNVRECFDNNILMFVIPDMEKNITVLSDMNLSVKDFSVVVINPYLATSKSSFNECGLGEYLHDNPIRLCTSYYRLRSIASNIVEARKNGGIIFRSLSDKKNYWLSHDITCGKGVL